MRVESLWDGVCAILCENKGRGFRDPNINQSEAASFVFRAVAILYDDTRYSNIRLI